MTLVHFLLALFASNHDHIRCYLLHFYRWQQPGMPGSWYAGYVRFLIRTYPHAMQSCINALHVSHGVITRHVIRACP